MRRGKTFNTIGQLLEWLCYLGFCSQGVRRVITVKASRGFHSGLRSFSTIGEFPYMVEHVDTGAVVMVTGLDTPQEEGFKVMKGVLLCYGDYNSGTLVVTLGDDVYIDGDQYDKFWQPYEGSILLASPLVLED